MEIITLGSKSPRRLEILEKLGMKVVVKPPNIIETFDDNLSVEENAIKISLDKLENVKTANPEDPWVVTADTFISINESILGKPKDRLEAKNMLEMLSGKSHKVVTGVSLYSKKQNKTVSKSDITIVKFKKLTKNEINFYLSLNEWKDAAGAYKIQETGEILIDSINGSYSSVMGLPISSIYGMFVSLNFIYPVI